MTRRTLAGLIAVPLLLVLSFAAVLLPVPYVTYSPGLTVDVLASQKGEEIVQVTGRRTYRTDGELRMTTVYVTQPDGRVGLLDAMGAWLDDERAIYPHDAVYPSGETAEQSQTESAIEMVSSQDAATAVALTELGYDIEPVVEVLNVTKGLPADGKLKVRDVFLEVNGVTITSAEQVAKEIQKVKKGDSVKFLVQRGGKEVDVAVTPQLVDGALRVGVTPGPGYTFPFQVSVNIPENIGGPSAGLMFSLAIYDTLTPGSLTGGAIVAGTGTIDTTGKVGPIGGIQQKVVAANRSGAELFLVPKANCADALNAPNDTGMRLVKATTMHEAREAIADWVKDPDAPLPSCEVN
ncbi:PDZ/DHR/GLGF domain protein [metagenome]|uniref:PDZ/DHR/GLGF domain protein n=1 Tax=metagenome TaxID=256318 RepID=A0A2P2C858_9ZZZZ